MEAKPAYKSFRYNNRLVWDSGRRGKTSAPGKPEMNIGSPPEFKGEPGIWCPEELLVASLNACLMLTFLSMAQRKGLEFVGYESAAEGLLENVEGKYRITEVNVQPSLVLKFDACRPGQQYCGLTKLMLNNAVQDSTYLSELLATELFRNAGVPAARVTHARVSLNGRDLGICDECLRLRS